MVHFFWYIFYSSYRFYVIIFAWYSWIAEIIFYAKPIYNIFVLFSTIKDSFQIEDFKKTRNSLAWCWCSHKIIQTLVIPYTYVCINIKSFPKFSGNSCLTRFIIYYWYIQRQMYLLFSFFIVSGTFKCFKLCIFENYFV